MRDVLILRGDKREGSAGVRGSRGEREGGKETKRPDWRDVHIMLVSTPSSFICLQMGLFDCTIVNSNILQYLICLFVAHPRPTGRHLSIAPKEPEPRRWKEDGGIEANTIPRTDGWNGRRVSVCVG